MIFNDNDCDMVLFQIPTQGTESSNFVHGVFIPVESESTDKILISFFRLKVIT